MRLSVLLISAAMASPAMAAVPEPEGPQPVEEKDAVLYGGLALSRVSADFSNLSDAYNMNIAAGGHLPWLTWLSGEAEFSFTIVPGNNNHDGTSSTITPCTVPPSMLDPDGTPDGCGTEVVTAVPGATASRNDLQMTNLGAFLVLRTPGRVYGVGRVGYRYLNTSIAEVEDDDEYGPAYGFGAGYRWRAGLSKFELMYTRYSEHLEYLGLGVVYGFGGSADDNRQP
jgi:hypothetical protein